MIGDDGAEVAMGVLKAADHKSDPSRRQWPKLAYNQRIFVHFRPI